MREKVRSYRETLAALQDELKETEARRKAILDAIEAIDAVLSSKAAGQFELPMVDSRSGGTRRRRGSILGPAVQLLRQARRPMHIDQIVVALRSRGVGDDSRSFRYSVSRSLDRQAVEEDSSVVKTAPATYTFREEMTMEGSAK